MIHFPPVPLQNLVRTFEIRTRTDTHTQNKMFMHVINEPKRFGWLMVHLISCLCAAFAIFSLLDGLFFIRFFSLIQNLCMVSALNVTAQAICSIHM